MRQGIEGGEPLTTGRKAKTLAAGAPAAAGSAEIVTSVASTAAAGSAFSGSSASILARRKAVTGSCSCPALLVLPYGPVSVRSMTRLAFASACSAPAV